MPARSVSRSRTRARRSPARAALRRYHAKRDLSASGEPGGSAAAPPPASEFPRFVIQKHDATRLHYDFRLEMDGVLKSWAVPKGVPTSPGDRSLAIEVEDHPLDYGGFEGIIPEGNYGAGTVMLWDRGIYTVGGGDPARAYREGKIHLGLVGHKCRGEWTLVRLKPRDEDKPQWLLLKNDGPSHARVRGAPKAVARDRSVLTGRTLPQIADGADSARWESNRNHAATKTPATRTNRRAAATRKPAARRARRGKPVRRP